MSACKKIQFFSWCGDSVLASLKASPRFNLIILFTMFIVLRKWLIYR